MSSKLGSLDQLRLTALRAKSYTAEQIAELADTLTGIIEDMNKSLEACEKHAQSAHAPADAEPNTIVGIRRNGTALEIKDKIVDVEVPTKTSELENDAQYATQKQVETAVSNAGYMKHEVVDELPTAAKADANTIYYLRKNDGKTGDQYDEYQFINGAPELIGGGIFDLSSYATVKSVEKADAALISEIVDKQTASAEKYVGTGNLLAFWNAVKNIIDTQSQEITALSSRIYVLETLANADISGNPFSVTFESLKGVNATGVYNQNESRMEF